MSMISRFLAGDRVEIIASDRYHIAGQQGTVKSASRDLVFVVLDRQPDLSPRVVIIDIVGDETRVASVFRSSEIRLVITPSA